MLTGTASLAQNYVLSKSLPPPVGGGIQTGGSLGTAVAVNELYTVVGAALDDVSGTDAGVVKVFRTATGEFLYSIPNPAPQAGDYFGYAVAISGTRVVVGAYLDNAGATDAGSAYVYDLARTTPTIPVATLPNPSPAASDHFGYAVAISGTRVVVGTPRDNTGESDSGIVYVYDLNSSSPTIPITLNNPTPAVGDFFGFAVGISGTRVVVGAHQDDEGATDAGCAYLFDLATPQSPVETLPNPNAVAGDGFGVSVAIDGTRIVVGAYLDDLGTVDAGAAYVFDFADGGLSVLVLNNPAAATGDNFGWKVGISGHRVVVGANLDDADATDGGSAYVYDLTAFKPRVPVATLSNPTPSASDYFSSSVAIWGTRVAIGAMGDDTVSTNSGSTYLYDLDNADPAVPVASLNQVSPMTGDRFGSSVAISSTMIVVGAPFDDTGATNAGSVYIYDRIGANPGSPKIALHNPSQEEFGNFGASVAISGNWLVVGSPGESAPVTDGGRAYVYDLSGANPTVPVVTLYNPSPALYDSFGATVSISANRIVVGAPGDDTGAANAGRVYGYDLLAPDPGVPVAIIGDPNLAANHDFGRWLAISGSRVVVGSPGDDAGAVDAGRVYVYDLSSATPTTPEVTLGNPGPGARDYFGSAVAISGSRVVVGAYLDDANGVDAGAVYVYDLDGPTPTMPQVSLRTLDPTPSGDLFGSALAISGSRVLAAAPSNDDRETDSGSVFVYDLNDANPSNPLAKLSHPAPRASYSFGEVAIDGVTALVGVFRDYSIALTKGYAFVFVPDDVCTQLPVLTLPTAHAIKRNPLSVYFTLPEAAASGSVTLAFAGSVNRSLTLAPSEGTSGVHSFSFDPANPVTTSQIVSIGGGTSIPDGVYTVTLSYQDLLGNPLSSSSSTNVRIDTTAPVLNLPTNVVAEATSAAGARVTYAVGASDPGGVGASDFTPESAGSFPLGTTTVHGSMSDLAGNVATGSFTVTVRDTIAPVVTPPANITVHATSPSGAVVNFTPTARDAVGVMSLISNPASGSLFPNGPITVTATAKDAANNTGTAQFTVTVTPLTAVEGWRYAAFGSAANTGQAANSADWDLDGLLNFQEFAFGTDPKLALSGLPALDYAGTLAGGGTIVNPGQPVVRIEGSDRRALFLRRTDYAVAGLSYSVEFSPDLATWQTSATTPTVLATGSSMELVSVPYPTLVGGAPARFFRVWVNLAP